MASISQRSHSSINNPLFDGRTISRAISIGMQLVHRHKMEGNRTVNFLDSVFLPGGFPMERVGSQLGEDKVLKRRVIFEFSCQILGQGWIRQEYPTKVESE